MNDENLNEAEAHDDVEASMVEVLQAEVDRLSSELQDANELIAALESGEQAEADAPQPVVGTEELRSLAATIRNCHRNGHPDATKHLDNLLRLLGA